MPPQLFLDPNDVTGAHRLHAAPAKLPEHVRKFGYLPDFGRWLPGDLLLFSDPGKRFIPRQIVKVQGRSGYAPENARWYHVAVYIGDGNLCEAVRSGVRCRPVADYVGMFLIRAHRDNALSEDERYRVVIRALMRLTRPYSFLSALRAWTLSLMSYRPFSKYRASRQAVMCSQLFHDAYMEASGRTLTDNVDPPILPADLSASSLLSDVDSVWGKLPS